MPAILNLLLQIAPLIPKLIDAGTATVDLYAQVQRVIDENRSPDQAEWDQLEAMIRRDQEVVRDTSRDTVSVTINGAQRHVPKRATYEQLVQMAGATGNPSMSVSFGDRSRAGRAPRAGETIDLDDGAHVTVVHTGNA